MSRRVPESCSDPEAPDHPHQLAGEGFQLTGALAVPAHGGGVLLGHLRYGARRRNRAQERARRERCRAANSSSPQSSVLPSDNA